MAFYSLFQVLGVGLGISLFLRIYYWLTIERDQNLDHEQKFLRRLLFFGLVIGGCFLFVLAWPVSETIRNQIFSIMGVVITGVLALSSTTIFANLLSGILLRITNSFRIGDFIIIGNHRGRVTERGLFDIEVQSEFRDLISFPNTFFMNSPVTTIRNSGTLVSAEVSLGYDVHHSKIESLLKKAAENSGLTEPFVHVLELGNFAVSYRVSGLLEDIKVLLTAASNLRKEILSILHKENIEIVSPNFMNQRQITEQGKFIPPQEPVNEEKNDQGVAEEIAFDKAEEAEQLAKKKIEVMETLKTLEQSLTTVSEDQKSSVQAEIELHKTELQELGKLSGEAGQGK